MSEYSSEAMEFLMEHHIDVAARRIYMWDRYDLEEQSDNILDGSVSLRILKGLAILSRSSKEPITIEVNSGGGYVSDGYAIYDAIRACPCHVTVEVTGQCASAATLALFAADRRLIHPSGHIMVHNGSVEMPSQDIKSAVSAIKFNDAECLQYYKILRSVTGKSLKFWEKMCQVDRYILAAEAKRLGLVHKVLKPKLKTPSLP